MLYRKIQPYIENYLRSDANKVLVIDGARQIGKTFIIRPPLWLTWWAKSAYWLIGLTLFVVLMSE